MAKDDARVAGAEGPGALHVDALAHALDLSANDPGGARPEEDADDDHDVEEARPPDRRDDDHQRHVRNHEEVVRDSHEHDVRLAPEVAGQDTDGAADQHRDERCRKTDDQGDACTPHQQRHHVDATVVQSERMAPRRMSEDRSDPRVQAVGRDPRREQCAHDHQRQENDADRGRRPPADRLPDEAAS